MKKMEGRVIEFGAAITQGDWALFWEGLPALDAEDLMWRDGGGNHVMMIALMHQRFEMAWVLMGKMMNSFPEGDWVVASNKLNESALGAVLERGELGPLEAFLKMPVLRRASSDQKIHWLSGARQKKPLAHRLAFNEYLKVWKRLEKWEPQMTQIMDDQKKLPIHVALEKKQWDMAHWLIKKTPVQALEVSLWSVWEQRSGFEDPKGFIEGWQWIFSLNLWDWASVDEELWQFWEKRGRQGCIREEFLEWIALHPNGPQPHKKWARFKQVNEWRLPFEVKKTLWEKQWIGWGGCSWEEFREWHDGFLGPEEERAYWVEQKWGQDWKEDRAEALKKRL